MDDSIAAKIAGGRRVPAAFAPAVAPLGQAQRGDVPPEPAPDTRATGDEFGPEMDQGHFSCHSEGADCCFMR